ncbi:hypothetical protein NPX13_g11198 [Xylaria arbuscula]|uniref:Phosphatidic acid phosphatase type 2/haloperoxidase domain-containing protein n=1 Tax=Xylaria arbuscula TaxID=114810 RepID=A0A9W8N3C1_9PEZI|nr:hypothetical protein NPX13_g11198 [Xylaria arbuscula]
MRSRSVSAVDDDVSSPLDPSVMKQIGVHNTTVAAVRRQAASPPVYLLLLAVLPFFLSVFIASSRWFDFRHHGFDILFGFLIGTISAYFAFRYYHMPIRAGGGWAWGPRSRDKAFWAGLGSWSYASDKKHWLRDDGGEEMQGLHMSGQDIELSGLRQRGGAGVAPPVVVPGDAPTSYHPNRGESSRTILEPQESEHI